MVHLHYALVVDHRRIHSSFASSVTETYALHVAVLPLSLLVFLHILGVSLQFEKKLLRSFLVINYFPQ